jgi:hypothetical protein
MIQSTVIKKTARQYRPQIKRIKEQPRHQIRKLLRSFEPLPQAKGAVKADR